MVPTDISSVDDDLQGENEVFEYLRNHDVAQLVDTAVQEMVKERPTSARMWLASYFAGEPGCETLLGRLAAMEKEVRKLELINRSLRAGIVEDPIHISPPTVSPQPHTTMHGFGDGINDSPWLTPSAQIFEEYIAQLDLGTKSHLIERPKQKVQIDGKSMLMVIDAQNDFFSVSTNNSDGGRFAVPEAEQAAPNIIMLMKTFANQGGRVIATRDYHPHNHCSFLAQKGKFPPHCIQGSTGSEFYPPIAACLKSLLDKKETLGRVNIAFKGFHEDIDSFGGLPYHDTQLKGAEAEKRVARRSEGIGSLSSWTGGFLLQQSNAERWDDNADPNAAPDVLAFQRIDKKDKKGSRVVEEVRACRRLFICGFPLDYGVIDTAVSAALLEGSLVQEIYIILDACRPAYVPGFGQHGTGFLQTPRWLLEKMQTQSNSRVTIRFIPTVDFLTAPETSLLMQEHSLSETVRSTEAGGGIPHSLGPFSIRKARAIRGGVKLLKTPTETTEGMYDLSGANMLTALKSYDVELCGELSHTSAINYFGVERRRVDIPDEADSFCWAYPLKGAHHLTEAQRDVLQCLHNANFSFPVFGGFLYLKDGKVVGANALSLGEGMYFDPPQKWPIELKRELIAAKRFKEVTFPALIKAGCHWFAWIRPKEIKV